MEGGRYCLLSEDEDEDKDEEQEPVLRCEDARYIYLLPANSLMPTPPHTLGLLSITYIT